MTSSSSSSAVSSSASSVRELLFSPLTIKMVHSPRSPHSAHSTFGTASMKFSESSTQTTTPTSAPAAAANMLDDASEDICAVCLEIPGEKNVVTTACGHRFCMSCLLTSLRTKNTCPTCRAEIEPSRQESIQPLNSTVAAELIQNEERDLDITRRIAVIGAFNCPRGRGAMILSLCRELAFGAAHSLAGWQGTSDDVYHASWREFEYNAYDSDSESSDDGSSSGSSTSRGSENGDDDNNDESLPHEPHQSGPRVVREVLPGSYEVIVRQLSGSESSESSESDVINEPRIEEVEQFDSASASGAPAALETSTDISDSASMSLRTTVTCATYMFAFAVIRLIHSVI